MLNAKRTLILKQRVFYEDFNLFNIESLFFYDSFTELIFRYEYINDKNIL